MGSVRKLQRTHVPPGGGQMSRRGVDKCPVWYRRSASFNAIRNRRAFLNANRKRPKASRDRSKGGNAFRANLRKMDRRYVDEVRFVRGQGC
jgi:hypothetical protein